MSGIHTPKKKSDVTQDEVDAVGDLMIDSPSVWNLGTLRSREKKTVMRRV